MRFSGHDSQSWATAVFLSRLKRDTTRFTFEQVRGAVSRLADISRDKLLFSPETGEKKSVRLASRLSARNKEAGTE